MGVDDSKLNNSTRSGTPLCKFCVSNQIVNGRLLHICRADLWKKHHKDVFNFASRVDCSSTLFLSKENIPDSSSHSKLSFFSHKKKGKPSKIAQHFEYNHIPAHLSSIQNLHFKGILCSFDGLVIVHLARRFYSQFGIIDLNLRKFLGTFGRQPENIRSDSINVQISPDCSYCLVKLPTSNFRRSCTLQLYNLRTRDLVCELPILAKTSYWSQQVSRGLASSGQQPANSKRVQARRLSHTLRALVGYNTLEHETNDLLLPLRPQHLPSSARAAPILFAFDPRFYNSRGVVANLNFDAGGCLLAPSLTLVRLPFWEPIVSTDKFGVRTRPTHHYYDPDLLDMATSMTPLITSPDGKEISALSPHILKLSYSRAGHLIFCLFSDTAQCRCPQVVNSSSSGGLIGGILSSANMNSSQQQLGGAFAGMNSANLSPFWTNRRQNVHSSSMGSLNSQNYSPGSSSSSSSSGYSSNISSPGIRASMEFVPRTDAAGHVRVRSSSPNHNNSTTMHRSWEEDSSFVATPAVETRASHEEDMFDAHLRSMSTTPGCQTLHLAIYHSDTLQLVRVHRFDRPMCPMHTCLSQFSFQESKCGGRIALTTTISAASLATLYRTVSSVANSQHDAPARQLISDHGTSFRKHSASCSCDQSAVDFNNGTTGNTSPRRSNSSNNNNSLYSNNSITANNHQQQQQQRPSALSLGGGSGAPGAVQISPQGGGGGGYLASSFNNATCCGATSGANTGNGYPSVSSAQSSASSSSKKLHEIVLVYRLPPPDSLQALARQKLLQICAKEDLPYLKGLPDRMLPYLQFRPVYTCSGSCMSRSSGSSATLTNISLDQ